MASSRRQIEKLIDKSEDEIMYLHKTIEMKMAYLQGLRDTLKYLPKEDATEVQAQLRAGTDLARAHDILRTEGQPLHVMELLKRLGREPTNKNRVSLSGSIGFYVRKNQFFTRPAPNTFAAIEQAEDQQRNGSSDEPPEGFGIDEQKAET